MVTSIVNNPAQAPDGGETGEYVIVYFLPRRLSLRLRWTEIIWQLRPASVYTDFGAI